MQFITRRHRVRIADAMPQFVLQQHPAPAPSAQNTQPASRLPALPRQQRACRLLSSSEPPLFLGTMWRARGHPGGV